MTLHKHLQYIIFFCLLSFFWTVGHAQSNLTISSLNESRSPNSFNVIEGHLFYDINTDCVKDNDERPLAGWIVRADGEKNYYGTTNELGYYSIPVEYLAGVNYTVRVFPPNDRWMVGCPPETPLSFEESLDSATLDFSIQQRSAPRAYPRVDISTPHLAPCEETNYTVRYANMGNAILNNTEIFVQLDASLEFLSADIIPTHLGYNRFKFQVGNLGILESNDFKIQVRVDCDAVIGQTHRAEAVMPQNDFLTDWNGPFLTAEANCINNDSAEFIITNITNVPMIEPQDYSIIIIEDDIVLRTGSILLDSLQDTIITLPTMGQTFRLEAEQIFTYPGDSLATASLEGCGRNADGDFTRRYVTVFSEDDNLPHRSIDFQENDENSDLQAYSKGYGWQHHITNKTPIEYLIHFQNNSEDSSQTLVIENELPETLDPTTIKLGASSHPYRFELFGERIIRFYFENMNLPNSSENPEGSHAFVKFEINQNPSNTVGTRIENQVLIFSDVEDVKLSNTVFHTIGQNFVLLTDVDDINPVLQNIKVFPNPFIETVYFELETDKNHDWTFSVYNTMGQLVHQQETSDNRIEFNRNNLASGIYFFTIATEGKIVHNGRVVMEN